MRTYIKKEYSKSIFKNYYAFFDDFLFKYGVISINIHGITDKENKFIPYLKFAKKNIFRENEGFLDLSSQGVSGDVAQRLMANYLISNLNFVPLDRLENWSDD
ncbi:hypothetical protein CGC58_05625 [Capnocytophaga stomatis]|uniref:Uncharacterized protein n=1 Tax=Capnocytophaga stomatis TaxID=1848904 RepID=A0A250FYT9_9FLAO|nr:hypothetical protein [Capnocytophaga stomatis]ATA89248.1 hypothetical protein CGC58_05625 [Capnocytophaga stomatis]